MDDDDPRPHGRDRRSRPRVGLVTVAAGPSLVTISHGTTFLVAEADSTLDRDSDGGDGLFADDTRFLSGHRLRLNGRPLRPLSSTKLSFRRARWALLAPDLVTLGGAHADLRVDVGVDRMVGDRRLHEDLVVTGFGREPVQLLLTLELASDFADLFEVRTQRWQRRSTVTTTWNASGILETRYRRDDFVRRCVLQVTGAPAAFANGELRFPIDLVPGGEWRACVQIDLLSEDRSHPVAVPCPLREGADDRAEALRRHWHSTVSRVVPADPRLLSAFEQSVEDFAALRLYDHDFSEDVWLPAAGMPWFVAPFGRDSLIASYQALSVHPLFAIGTLQKLGEWQATDDDPVRDAEPGKICHEMRVGEWAHFGTVPHSPYYGTADATPLYLLLLAETVRWLGDAEGLRRFRPVADRCLEWIDRHGDRDGDGLQEYAPRTPAGYRNQCWRDAEDGVLDEAGGNPPHPIGTCEMQAYVIAAKREVAQLYDLWGDAATAARLRREAKAMRERFLAAFWDSDRGELALALDGGKRRVMTATSNPGHCLWMGVLDDDRARAVTRRLLAPDLFTGFGLRTLSSDHPAYDPHSYQRGSVWPHDTVMAAAGMLRYGLLEEAWLLLDGVVAAASCFPHFQLPELFGGQRRAPLDAPTPYERANVPQAWAAGAVFHAVRVLLGVDPDLPAGRLHVDPALPPWCPELVLSNVRVGERRLEICARRRDDGGADVEVAGADGLTVVRHPRRRPGEALLGG